MGLRRKGRVIAVQTLYSLEYLEDGKELNEAELESGLADITGYKDIGKGSKVFEFALEIILNLSANRKKIDETIIKHSKNWSFDRIAKLDLCILRIAVYELGFTTTAPAIVMNEAIEISKKYCSESSGKFINGILNAISNEIKDSEAH